MGLGKKISKSLKNSVLLFEPGVPAPLNDAIQRRLKNCPKTRWKRFLGLSRKEYEFETNERIVEIPFLYRMFQIPAGGSVLDFGCVDSKVSIELASLGYKVTGVDLRDYPFHHPNLTFVKGNFLNNPMQNESFDAVVAISAVEHCGLDRYYGETFSDGDRKIVDEFYRFLKKGGLLIITVPFGKKTLVPGNYRVYDSDSLSKLLENFEVLKAEYFFGKERQNWTPVLPEELADIGPSAQGIVQGVACICAKKTR